MAGMDGTGPQGGGPMTGRGMGSCVLRFEAGESPTITGFVGAAGRPVQWTADQTKENQIMPRGDGTGPNGMGAMTGRAAGYCAGYQVPGFANPMGGRGGFGRGFGGGRGFGRGFGGGRGGRWGAMPYAAPYAAPAFAVPSAEQERDALQQQVFYLETTLDDIRKRLADLTTAKNANN